MLKLFDLVIKAKYKLLSPSLFKYTDKNANLRSEKSLRVLFQPLTDKGALGFIDRGSFNGYIENGADVVIWNPKTNTPDINRILEEFKPTHFIGYLQDIGHGRPPSAWTKEENFNTLLKYKEKNGLYTAISSCPSNIEELLKKFPDDVQDLINKLSERFYIQPNKPNKIEKKIINTGFIDLIRSRFAAEVYDIAFKNFLDLGLKILEEPYAAEDKIYTPQNLTKTNDIVFVGNSTLFKFYSMKDYVYSLKQNFSDKFKIYGMNWSENLSCGSLKDKDVIKTVSSTKVNIAFHDPTQTLNRVISGNERPYKLLAMKSFVISDSNPLLKKYFEVDQDLVIADSPSDMVDKCHYYLENYDKALEIAENGYKKVIAEHTYKCRAKRVIDVLNSKNSCQIIKYKN